VKVWDCDTCWLVHVCMGKRGAGAVGQGENNDWLAYGCCLRGLSGVCNSDPDPGVLLEHKRYKCCWGRHLLVIVEGKVIWHG